MDNVFGQPEIIEPENEKNEGSNPTLIVILIILILLGGGVLGFLLYRQSQEEPIVLDEVVETIPAPIPGEVTNELPVMEPPIASDGNSEMYPPLTGDVNNQTSRTNPSITTGDTTGTLPVE